MGEHFLFGLHIDNREQMGTNGGRQVLASTVVLEPGDVDLGGDGGVANEVVQIPEADTVLSRSGDERLAIWRDIEKSTLVNMTRHTKGFCDFVLTNREDIDAFALSGESGGYKEII